MTGKAGEYGLEGLQAWGREEPKVASMVHPASRSWRFSCIAQQAADVVHRTASYCCSATHIEPLL